MKVFSLLLSVFILGLACYPCSDRFVAADGQEVTMGSVLTVSAYDQHVPADDDCCSPFCFCLCCTAHAQLRPAVVFFTPASYSDKVITPICEGDVVHHYFGIWQPPKAV